MIHEIDHVLYLQKNSLNFQIILILMKILCLFRANYTYTIFFGSFLIKSIHKVSSFFLIFYGILWKFFIIR